MTMTNSSVRWVDALEFGMADRLRKTLNASGVSVERCAQYFGVTRGTVGNWINGRIMPDIRTLRLWSHAFRVPLEWIEYGTWPTTWDANELLFADVERLLEEESLKTRNPAEAGISSDVRPEGFEPPAY